MASAYDKTLTYTIRTYAKAIWEFVCVKSGRAIQMPRCITSRGAAEKRIRRALTGGANHIHK
jgi:hypothetical protein